MRFLNLFSFMLMICLTNLCMAQKPVVMPVQKINAIKMDFNSQEKDYAQVQNELKQLEQQKLQLLTLMHNFNEQQKQVMGKLEKLEKSYDGMRSSAGGSDSQNQLLAATKQMQETQMSFNLQYLQLQSQMQQENRSYTAVSNIMKTKHDTVKNSISNIR